MGMNFYRIYNKCDHCGRSDREHIGKSSIGWRFIFSGDNHNTFQDWKAVLLLKDGGTIVDETGKEISPDNFLNFVKMKLDSKSHKGQYDHDIFWIDDLGYEFLLGEFS